MSSLRAMRPAFWQRLVISAPEHPFVSDAKYWMSTSLWTAIFERVILNISFLPSSSGGWTYTNLSKRPGRSNAASLRSAQSYSVLTMEWGLFVAAKTITFTRFSMPSISFSKVASTLFVASSVPPVDDVKASISSWRQQKCARLLTKNTMLGLADRALRKTSRIARSLSPRYLLNISGPRIAIKFKPDSVATALAVNVLEHPGGP